MNQPGTYVNKITLNRHGRFPAGFSLVELLVAMVIGLLGIVVMMQVFKLFEEQKRTTTGGDDAISSGVIALNGIQRDIQQSGWGISSPQIIGCDVTGLIPGGVAISLRPVTINPIVNSVPIVGDANTDTLLVITGNSNGMGEGDLIDAQPAAGDPVISALYPNAYAVRAAASFAVAERVVAAPLVRPASCSLSLTNIAGVNRPNVAVAAGVTSPAMVGGRLFNLGTAPMVRLYSIRNGNLTVCDYTANDCAASAGALTVAQQNARWVPIANNVVSLRAEYGRDSNTAGMDAVVDVWDQTVADTATPVSSNSTKNLQACGLVRASAVRIALVARSSQPEKTTRDASNNVVHVTTAVPVWAGSDAAAAVVSATNAAAVAISPPSPSASWPTWQDFRYKVFQTTVPLRNITTMGVISTC